jgi:NAD(P)H-hydrate epimerase
MVEPNLPILLSREQIRAVDRIAITEYQIPGIVLMENAGRGVADTLERLGIRGGVVICCGGGNNGGDGFVVARHLQIRGYAVQLILWADPARIQGDALTNYQIACRMDLPIALGLQMPHDQIGSILNSAEWLVDALLGTGAMGDPKPPIASAIEQMNRSNAKRLAIDLPSGLDCDTGMPSATTVRAAHTCTFFAEKPAMRVAEARSYLGQVHLLDIGAPREIVSRVLVADAS